MSSFDTQKKKDRLTYSRTEQTNSLSKYLLDKRTYEKSIKLLERLEEIKKQKRLLELKKIYSSIK